MIMNSKEFDPEDAQRRLAVVASELGNLLRSRSLELSSPELRGLLQVVRDLLTQILVGNPLEEGEVTEREETLGWITASIGRIVENSKGEIRAIVDFPQNYDHPLIASAHLTVAKFNQWMSAGNELINSQGYAVKVESPLTRNGADAIRTTFGYGSGDALETMFTKDVMDRKG